jgi:hypothetical protein
MRTYPSLQINTLRELVGVIKGIQQYHFHVEVQARIRKLHEGKWYTSLVSEKGVLSFPSPEDELFLINEVVSRCNQAAYKFLLFGIVDPELQCPIGKIFEIDPDQRSEAERLNVIPYTTA